MNEKYCNTKYGTLFGTVLMTGEGGCGSEVWLLLDVIFGLTLVHKFHILVHFVLPWSGHLIELKSLQVLLLV